MTTEQEQFDQQLAQLEAEYGPENVTVMGRRSFPQLTLIWEEKEYEPSEEVKDEKGRTKSANPPKR